MFDPGVTGSGASDFVTARSGPATIVEADALLFPAFASVEVELTVAVLVIVAPGAAVAVRVIEKVAVAPTPSVAMEHEIVPVPPTEGLEHEKPGPPVCDSEKNVAPGGMASARVTPSASLVPTLETVTVYAMLPTEPTEAGPVFATETSDPTTTVVFVVAVVLSRC